MAKAKKKAENIEFEGGVGENEDGGLVVDLGGVDDDGGFEAIPRAIYNCTILNLTFEHSQRSGNPMWTWELEVADGEYAGRHLFTHTTFNEGGLPRTKRAIARVMPELLEKPFDPEEVANSGVMLGKALRARVDIKPYEGRKTNNVRDILAPEDGDGFGE